MFRVQRPCGGRQPVASGTCPHVAAGLTIAVLTFAGIASRHAERDSHVSARKLICRLNARLANQLPLHEAVRPYPHVTQPRLDGLLILLTLLSHTCPPSFASLISITLMVYRYLLNVPSSWRFSAVRPILLGYSSQRDHDP